MGVNRDSDGVNKERWGEIHKLINRDRWVEVSVDVVNRGDRVK